MDIKNFSLPPILPFPDVNRNPLRFPPYMHMYKGLTERNENKKQLLLMFPKDCSNFQSQNLQLQPGFTEILYNGTF